MRLYKIEREGYWKVGTSVGFIYASANASARKLPRNASVASRRPSCDIAAEELKMAFLWIKESH